MIRAFKPLITPSGSSVCVTFTNNKKEVSIALNDSCGRLQMLSRSDIRLFEIDEKTGEFINDVTASVFGTDARGDIDASMTNFQKAMKWLERAEWNPEGV